jgi:hypothetical protein
MSATTNPYYSTSLKVTTQKIGSRTYRIGECHSGYYVRESETGARVDFYSLASLEWFIAMLKDAAGDTDPEPTPGAPALRLVYTSTVSAVSDSKRENKVSIPTKPVGERYPINTPIRDAYQAFLNKHGIAPNSSYIDVTNQLYVCYDPAKAA